MGNENNGGFKLPKLSTFQLFNLCVGIIGIQFAWSMQIALSSRVLEPLGADPFLFGLIWCAGPVTGLLIQPIVGAVSDRTWTKIGRRRPFLLVGAFLGGASLLFFPFAPTLLIAALLIWVIDACVNISQGPYRALVPDTVPPEQHAVANSYLNFAFGAGSVIALGVAPLLNQFNIDMSVAQQYIMASFALILFIIYTSLTIKEYAKSAEIQEQKKKESIAASYKKFLSCNREIHKICGVQFLTWMGIMCMFIYLTQYTVHYIYKLPDMSTEEYKVIKSEHQILNGMISNIDNDKISDSNLKLNSLLEKTYTEINDENEQEKYQQLNDELDILVLDSVKDKKEFEKSYAENIDKLLEETMPASKTKSEKLKTLNNKLSADYKTLLLQFNLLESKKIRENTTLLTENKEIAQQIKATKKEINAAQTIAKKNDVNIDKKLPKYDIDSVKTTPMVLAKFFNQDKMNLFHLMELAATNTTQWALVAFNFIPLLIAIPLGYICNKTGKKLIYTISLLFIAISFGFAPFLTSANNVIIMMACAGVAWATILSIPFAFLCDYMPEGEEGTMMGIFNMFIAGPQLISAIIIGYIINISPLKTVLGTTHNWSIAFIVASVSVFLAIIALQFVKEKTPGISSTSVGGGH